MEEEEEEEEEEEGVSKGLSIVISGEKFFSGSFTLKKTVKRPFETSITTATPPNILEDLKCQQYHCKNLKYRCHI
jgi:hypothetical protein